MEIKEYTLKSGLQFLNLNFNNKKGQGEGLYVARVFSDNYDMFIDFIRDMRKKEDLVGFIDNPEKINFDLDRLDYLFYQQFTSCFFDGKNLSPTFAGKNIDLDILLKHSDYVENPGVEKRIRDLGGIVINLSK